MQRESDLNVRPETKELLEEKRGKKILDTGLGNYFLDKSPKAHATKTKISTNTLKSFCIAKETTNKLMTT